MPNLIKKSWTGSRYSGWLWSWGSNSENQWYEFDERPWGCFEVHPCTWGCQYIFFAEFGSTEQCHQYFKLESGHQHQASILSKYHCRFGCKYPTVFSSRKQELKKVLLLYFFCFLPISIKNDHVVFCMYFSISVIPYEKIDIINYSRLFRKWPYVVFAYKNMNFIFAQKWTLNYNRLFRNWPYIDLMLYLNIQICISYLQKNGSTYRVQWMTK